MDLAALAAVLAALGGVVKLVLDAMARQDDRHSKAMDQMAQRQEKFLGNHMSGITRALEDVAKEMHRLVNEATEAHREAAKRGYGVEDDGSK